jgi:hypothetical protein
MKMLKVAFVAAVMSVGLMASQASASSIDLGEIDENGKEGYVINIASDIEAFEDTISFSLAAVTTSLFGEISDITLYLGAIPLDSVNFTLQLFSALDPLTAIGDTFTDPTGTGFSFSYLDLAAGDYFFRISGEVGAPLGNGYNYKFNVNVTETPIPPALLLFGTALGGLGFASYRKRKMAAKAA